MARDEVGRFDDLLSAKDAERLISEPGLRLPAFRLLKAGARLDPGEYTVDLSWRPTPFTGTARVDRVLAEFADGATVVLQGLHLNWAPLATYCRELEAFLGHPAQANAYLTPRQSQGLPVHHDTHDVLVLQVSGSKRWLVSEPVLELPLRDQRYSPELGAPETPLLDVTLRAGDTLYLPRGWLHEALTSDDDSLHLTIGVNVVTWLDAFRAALERCGDEVEFRRSFPPDGDGDTDRLLALLAAHLERDRIAARMRARFVESRRPILNGQLGQLRALDRLDRDTPVQRRPTVIADLAGSDGGVALSYEGKRIRFPARARAAVEYAFDATLPFRPAELPGLDETGQLVLVRRLVRDGFLRLTERELEP